MPKPPSTAVMPDPKRERRSRRKFTTEYTLRVIAEADACARGELGPMPRREGLYSNQLHQWRRELADGGVAKLAKSTPGPAPKLTPEQREIEQLRRDKAKLERELEIAWRWIDATGDTDAAARRVHRGMERQSRGKRRLQRVDWTGRAARADAHGAYAWQQAPIQDCD